MAEFHGYNVLTPNELTGVWRKHLIPSPHWEICLIGIPRCVYITAGIHIGRHEFIAIVTTCVRTPLHVTWLRHFPCREIGQTDLKHQGSFCVVIPKVEVHETKTVVFVVCGHPRQRRHIALRIHLVRNGLVRCEPLTLNVHLQRSINIYFKTVLSFKGEFDIAWIHYQAHTPTPAWVHFCSCRTALKSSPKHPNKPRDGMNHHLERTTPYEGSRNCSGLQRGNRLSVVHHLQLVLLL